MEIGGERTLLPDLRLDAVTFRCRTTSGIQTSELGALSCTQDVLREKGSILLDGVQPRGNQREALQTKDLVILPWTGFLPSKIFFLTAIHSCPREFEMC